MPKNENNTVVKTVSKKKPAESKTNVENEVKAPSESLQISNEKIADANDVADQPILKKSTKAKTKKPVKHAVKFVFELNYATKPGENIFITGNHSIFGNNNVTDALPLQYLNETTWVASIDADADTVDDAGIMYNYLLKQVDGSVVYDWGSDKKIDKPLLQYKEVFIKDSWNYAGYYGNVFYTEPFKKVLLKNNLAPVKIKPVKRFTHIFKIKAPLLNKNETVCFAGSADEFGNWNENEPVLLNKNINEDFFSVAIDLSKTDLPLFYKYGVYDVKTKQLTRYEDGSNRVLFHTHAAAENKISVINDGFIRLQDDAWKGAGVSIPVFGLRSKNSWGVGEFNDLKLMVDWAKKTGLQLIQILPVNDTSATDTWVDSYPYAAISAFALHPMYVNIEQLAGDKNKLLIEEFTNEAAALNTNVTVDYEAVNAIKWKAINKLYAAQKTETFSSQEYKNFYQQNKHWLVPYAVFCFLRDENKTADFNNWSSNRQYSANDVVALLKNKTKANKVAIHFFVQYHLHVQLKQASEYAHEQGIIIKGDIPIGVYRYGADAWQHPELYHMDLQAGAPPDDFAVKGQNWGFPTYNWQKMSEDDFAWWKKRFEQMSNYFDAFRIDHILGFFRIWSIPMDAVEGILGYFEPCIPAHINEFGERNIWFDHHRYTKPFINDQILYDRVGNEADFFKKNYLTADGYGNYNLKEEFSTQRKTEDHFISIDAKDDWKKIALFDLISNVILFEVKGSNGQQYHFRFNIESTKSFQYLDGYTQSQLRSLYVDYFFRRQDDFWKKEAMKKLPALKRSTNMLVCGEDLGLVPTSVPSVMRDLGLLSLEIQRMPKQTDREFFHPNDAPYLSVVTPSTHDMSTIRGWWEEDRAKTQRFYNYIMGEWGNAPFYCESWINENILKMHYYSPAMWSIFQLQDILGTSAKLRRQNPDEERINVPAIPNYYWRYRMHLYLEDLLEADDFNNELLTDIETCGRSAKN